MSLLHEEGGTQRKAVIVLISFELRGKGNAGGNTMS